MHEVPRASRNRTVTLNSGERAVLSRKLVRLANPPPLRRSWGEPFAKIEVLHHLPKFVDLLIVDPPYNLGKSFNGRTFRVSEERYESWIDSYVRSVGVKPQVHLHLL